MKKQRVVEENLRKVKDAEEQMIRTANTAIRELELGDKPTKMLLQSSDGRIVITALLQKIRRKI